LRVIVSVKVDIDHAPCLFNILAPKAINAFDVEAVSARSNFEATVRLRGIPCPLVLWYRLYRFHLRLLD